MGQRHGRKSRAPEDQKDSEQGSLDEEQGATHKGTQRKIKEDDVGKCPYHDPQENLGSMPPATIVLLKVIKVSNVIDQEIHQAHQEKLEFVGGQEKNRIRVGLGIEKEAEQQGKEIKAGVSTQQDDFPFREWPRKDS